MTERPKDDDEQPSTGQRRRQRITIGIVVAIAAAALASRALIKPAATTSPNPLSSSSSSATAPVPPNGPRALATVGVYDDGAPAVDRWVVFHDEAGTVTSSMKTGKDGKASGLIGPKSMVTAVYGVSVQHLITIVGVEPNDQLVIGEDEDDESGPSEPVVCNALVSIREKYPNAMRYLVSLGVGRTEVSDAKPTSMPVLKRFVVDGKFRVLAEAVDASGKPIAFAHAWIDQCASPDAGSAADAGPVATPTPSKDVKLPAWSTDFRPFVLAVTAGGVAVDPLTAHGEYAIVVGEDRFDRGHREAPIIPGDAGAGGAASAKQARLSFSAPRPLGANAKYKIAIGWDGSRDRSVLDERRPDMPELLDLDVDARMLPRVSEAVLDPSPSHPARPAVRWRVAPGVKKDGGDNASSKLDATIVRLSWPPTREHVWTIVIPPDAKPRFAIPALPDELATYRPNARDAIATSVAILDASFLDGFADVKKKGLGVLEEERPEKSTVRNAVTGDLDF